MYHHRALAEQKEMKRNLYRAPVRLRSKYEILSCGTPMEFGFHFWSSLFEKRRRHEEEVRWRGVEQLLIEEVQSVYSANNGGLSFGKGVEG